MPRALPRAGSFARPSHRNGTRSMNRSWRSLLAVAIAWLLATPPFPRRHRRGGLSDHERGCPNGGACLADQGERWGANYVPPREPERRTDPFGGIAVAYARRARIVASLGNGATTTLGSISVAAGDVLSADGEALWIEVDGLARDLPLGGTIEATVSFGAAVIPISLTVDRANEPSN